MLQVAIDHSQAAVSGDVRLRLFKGNVDVVGRRSDGSLFDEKIVTFEEDGGAYDQSDASGFIRLHALRLRTLARRRVGS
jgi:argininosuccinate synthase